MREEHLASQFIGIMLDPASVLAVLLLTVLKSENLRLLFFFKEVSICFN